MNLNRYICTFSVCFFASIGFGQSQIIPFDSTHWELGDAAVQEYLGKTSLMGKAILREADFENGVIEFDLAVNGERSYPGVLFRMQDSENYERFYIRPHLPKTFQNVLQYVGTFKGIDSWQLYNGPGCTASAAIPHDQWVHITLKVRDTQAMVFINNAPEPALHITGLAHGLSKGGVGLMGPKDGSAWFADFSCHRDEQLAFPAPVEKEMPLGMLVDWEISQVFPIGSIDIEQPPESQGLQDLKWQKIKSMANGLVDISRHFGRQSGAPDCIWAKTLITSEKDQTKQFAFGYSDIITVFLNGKPLFSGNSAYTSRDPSFQGIVGLNDYIYLPLTKGTNELMICLAESFGGWGFMFQDAKAIFQHSSLINSWEIVRTFNYPESVVYDPKRNICYVSNYFNDRHEFISKVRLDGTVESREWVTGILQPTGMCIDQDRLYVVGRFALIEIDLSSGRISNRYPFTQPQFPNDVTADGNGSLYITDSQRNVIIQFSGGKMNDWLQNEEIGNPNGILVHQDKLLVGTSADGAIKVVDLKTKHITRLATLGAGTVMDGIRSDGRGNYLISDYSGRIFRVTPSGQTTLLLNTTVPKYFCADFEYIPEQRLLIVPTLEDNRLMAFKLRE